MDPETEKLLKKVGDVVDMVAASLALMLTITWAVVGVALTSFHNVNCNNFHQGNSSFTMQNWTDRETVQWHYCKGSTIVMEKAVPILMAVAAAAIFYSEEIGRSKERTINVAKFCFVLNLGNVLTYAIWRIIERAWTPLLYGMLIRTSIIAVAGYFTFWALCKYDKTEENNNNNGESRESRYEVSNEIGESEQRY